MALSLYILKKGGINMASKRNLCQLEFQKRLIRTANQSPKAEALNMFAIVADNLKEFAEVRIPLDGDTDGIVAAYVDTVELLNSAIARKFPTLHTDHQAGPIGLLDMEVEHKHESPFYPSENLKYKPGDTEVRRTMIEYILGDLMGGIRKNGDEMLDLSRLDKGGLYNWSGRFYHSIMWLWDLVCDKNWEITKQVMHIDQEEENQNPLLTFYGCAMVNLRKLGYVDQVYVGNVSRISAPENITSDQELAIAMLDEWAEAGVDAMANHAYETKIVFRYYPGRPDRGEPMMPIELEDMNGSTYIYEIDNPLMLNTAAVMRRMLPDAKAIGGLNYAKDIEEIREFRGYSTLSQNPGNWHFVRGPLDDGNLNILQQFFNIDIGGPFSEWEDDPHEILSQSGITKQQLETWLRKYHDTRHSNSHWYPKEFWMTIYRTDSIPDFAYAGNGFVRNSPLFYIATMALMLKKNAHFFIECRARGDEVNNLKLAKLLMYYGADVHVVAPEFEECKVHAKLISARIAQYHIDGGWTTTLYSTGNFQTSSMKQFSDSYYISVNDGNVADFFKTLLAGKKVDYNPASHAFWLPGDIRRKLLAKITAITKTRIYEPYGLHPFIWIKVNHLTDRKICDVLMKAAKAGVQVRIICRTTCMLPNNVNPNLSIKSVCGKYLEHDRYFIFGYYYMGALDKSVGFDAYISSADLMERNLDRRIEIMKKLPGTSGELVYNIFEKMWRTPTDAASGYFNYEI